mgnify:FL=1
MVLDDGVEEEIVASGGPSSRVRVPRSEPIRLVSEREPAAPHPAAVTSDVAANPSEYDRVARTRPLTAARTGVIQSPLLSDSLMEQLVEAGHMPMMEFYAECNATCFSLFLDVGMAYILGALESPNGGAQKCIGK